MRVSHCAVLGCALVAIIGSQPAWGHILMPAGSKVWMEFKGSSGADSNDDDIAGSNLPGVAPPNGIPLITASDVNGSVTGFAEILPNRVRTWMRGLGSSGFMHASFQDTYTVGGTATGPFSITFSLRITGTARSVPSGPFQVISGAGLSAEIGTFFPDPTSGGDPINEQFRINPFSPATETPLLIPTQSSTVAPFEVPIDITATYTKTGVNVGDVFDIGYGVNSAFSRAEIDLLNTGTISFALPEGVTLSSSLAQSIPEPNAPALLAAACGLALTVRRPLRGNRHTA